jgi:hypothetical protein
MPSNKFTADDLRIARHREFCMALPFPSMTWNDKAEEEANLAKLHDYAVQLANSGIDWYLQKKEGKELRARITHWFTYGVAVLAAIIPLFLIVVPELQIFRWHIVNPAGIAAEAALVLIGIAGGITLIDRSAGFSADWMRYILTATRLNRTLVEFEFDWNALGREASQSYQPQPLGAATPSAPAAETVDPVQRRIDRVQKFSLAILDIIGGETELWANELKERVAQLAKDLRQQGR